MIILILNKLAIITLNVIDHLYSVHTHGDQYRH